MMMWPAYFLNKGNNFFLYYSARHDINQTLHLDEIPSEHIRTRHVFVHTRFRSEMTLDLYLELLTLL
jgi:hypothetical protein